MRLYLYINREYLKLLAPKIANFSFDINYFEYTEKRSCTLNDNVGVRPEVVFNEEKCPKKKVEILKDNSEVSNMEIIKRYINIDDISEIKNNNLYFNIIESIVEDNRIKCISGVIKVINEDNTFVINDYTIIYNDECAEKIIELEKYKCNINCFVFELNCLQNSAFVGKLLTIFLE